MKETQFKPLFLVLLTLAIFLVPQSLSAQWKIQQITLNPGWNSIYLEVDPVPSVADSLFAGETIESAWEWNQLDNPAQFISDANELNPQLPEWSTWFPADSNKRLLANLYELRGGRSYLINNTGNAPVQLELTGKPVQPSGKWTPDNFSLTGFQVGRTPPTFASYFSQSEAHQNTQIFRMGSNGRWAFVSPLSRILPGVAYWIKTIGPSSYKGPVEIELERSDGLVFGRSLQYGQLVVRNHRETVSDFTLQIRSSATAPEDTPVVAGDVALLVRDYDTVGTQPDPEAPQILVPSWEAFEGPLTFSVPAKQDLLVYLATDRATLAGTDNNNDGETVYQSLIEINENGGTRHTVPVSVSLSRTSTVGQKDNNGAGASFSGLWVGTATLNAVSWAGGVSPDIAASNPDFNSEDRNTPRPTPSTFLHRILIHVDSRGNARLLQKVIQVWEEGTTVPDPNNPDLLINGTPGRFRLFSNEEGAAPFTGATLRSGIPVPKRLSTSSFPIREPLELDGTFNDKSLGGSIFLSHNDSLNPFKHKFHPQHDNQDARYENALPPGVESHQVNRSLEFRFSENHPEGRNSPGWGYSEVGGTYHETITGVHKLPLNVSGTFLLRRVSEISEID